MTQDDVLFGYRLQLFALAARTSVSHACRTFGVHRSTYYAWKRQVDRHGLEMLRPRERRRPQMPNALPRMIRQVERELGGCLRDMSREEKQRAIHRLDERGAFALRKSVEDIADAMGVSRMTVYTYLETMQRNADEMAR